METFQNDIQSLPPIDIGNISQTFEEIYQSIQQITQQLVEEDNGSEYDTCEEILDDYYEEKEEIKEMNYCLKVYNDNEEGTIPKRIHNADAGFDLYYSGTGVLTVSPQQTVLIDTKIAIEISTIKFSQGFHLQKLVSTFKMVQLILDTMEILVFYFTTTLNSPMIFFQMLELPKQSFYN